MTVALGRIREDVAKAPAPVIVAGLAFLVCFWQPMTTLGRDWWNDPEAGHGLLLFPISLWLAWKRGISPRASAQPLLGLVLLLGAVVLRYLSGLAAELFTMRMSLMGAAGALVIHRYGWRQLTHWWLPVLLLLLSVPLPAVIVGSLALPLQLVASKWGAALLELRNVPVRLAGNVIQLPGQSLFVTEACSGLRSLTALISLGLLVAGLWLRTPVGRALLVLSALPVAMMLNAVRIFITGFFVFYVDPRLAQGIMHYTEGWVIFVVAFAILGAMAWVVGALEGGYRRVRAGRA
jgi:exosortase